MIESAIPKRPPLLPCLSVVVPAYNEEQRLPTTLEKVAAFLRENVDGPSEVLVVNDGSTNGTGFSLKAFADLRI